jgi:deoxyribonuclease V
MDAWPATAEELVRAQEELARAAPPRWRPVGEDVAAAACFVCFERGPSGPGRRGETAWAGAAVTRGGRLIAHAAVTGVAGDAYEPGLLALREGPVLERAVGALTERPDVLLVDATGRDHPRRAGLALQLGAILDRPSVGVTHRPLLADGDWPADEGGACSPLWIDDELVGYWLRTRPGTRPLAVHAAWRTDAEAAVELVLRTLAGVRTPEPLRAARTAARAARARADLRRLGSSGEGAATLRPRGVSKFAFRPQIPGSRDVN